MVEEEKYPIGLNQVKYIGEIAKCPACSSRDVAFSLPFECHIKTKEGNLEKVVLDFSNPEYWLKNTQTRCAFCGFQFHLRDINKKFYEGLMESIKKDEFKNIITKWEYNFDNYSIPDE